jgi:hypothetical protein
MRGRHRGEAKDSQCLVQVLVHLHNSCLVATAIAIVGGREDRHHIHHMRPIVALREGREEPERDRVKDNLAERKEESMVLTSMTSWCARETRERLFLWLNISEMSLPKVYPAPRGEIPQPFLSSGSDQRRSHMGPSWGTSCTRSICLI